MILLTFVDGEAPRLGVKSDAGVIDVVAAQAALGPVGGAVPSTVDGVIGGGDAARAAVEEVVRRAGEAGPAEGAPWLRSEGDLRFGPCLPRPGKIVCVGLNYAAHVTETDATRQIPDEPVLFMKPPSALIGPGQEIEIVNPEHNTD